jgi:PTS system nitrogen regulatory IIA component
MTQVAKAVAAFIQLPKGVDFDAIDGQPVDLAFAMLVPKEATQEHLQLLAQLAKMFSDSDFCNALRHADSAKKLLQLIQQKETQVQA